MTDYVAAFTNPASPYHSEAKSLAERFSTRATITDGLMRWMSNDTVPPKECVALAAHLGLPVDVAKCDAARDAETQAFLRQYRQQQSKRPASAEQRAEMRAAFGSGATVVNIVTGRKTKL